MGKRYWRLFAAYLINTIGDEFYLLALPLVLLVLGYRTSIVTFIFSAMMFATVLGGLGLGYLVDRHPASVVVLRSYAASALALVAGAGAVRLGVSPYGVVIVVALALGVLAALSAAAVDAGIPESIEDPACVSRGYSLVESARAAAAFLGPAAAGVITRLHELVGVLLGNALSFAVSAGLVWQRSDRKAPPAATGSRWAEILAGTRVVRSHRALRRGVLLSLIGNISLGAAQPLFLTRMVRDLHVSPLLTSAVIIGAGVASIVAVQVHVHVAARISALSTMIVADLLMAAAAIGIGLSDRWYVSGLLYCLMATAAMTYNVYWRTFRQQLVGRQLLGRVSAACRSLAYLATAVGALVTGLLQNAGVPVAILFLVGGLVCGAATIPVGVRARRPAPEEPSDAVPPSVPARQPAASEPAD